MGIINDETLNMLVYRCKEGCMAMLKNLKQVKNMRKIKLTLELMEVCSKNGNLAFHKYLSAKEFAE